jgi:hypothetical protein
MRRPVSVTTAFAAGSNSATISGTRFTPAGMKSAVASTTLSIGHTPVATSMKPGWQQWLRRASTMVTLAPSNGFIRRLATATPPRPLPAMTMRAWVFNEACACGTPAPAASGSAPIARSQRRSRGSAGRTGVTPPRALASATSRCVLVISCSASNPHRLADWTATCRSSH